MKEKKNPPVQMNERVWWLGRAAADSFLQENTWLILDAGKAILVDPGPVAGFRETFRAFGTLCDLGALSAIVVTQSDPDACASLPLWENEGFFGKVIAHWKTALLLPSLGLRSGFRSVHHDETDESGVFLGLRFIPLSLAGTVGSMGVFDPGTRALFTGNFLGAFGKNAPLLRSDGAIEDVVRYHEQHVPTGEVARHVLDILETTGAALVCPQHGSARDSSTMNLYQVLRKANYGVEDSPEDDSPEKRELRVLREEHLRLQENVVLSQDDAMVDRLTGLYNRTYFDELLPAFVQGNPGGAVASLRLDGLKGYGTENGEDAVNQALRVFAKIVTETRGERTMVFRDAGRSLILLFDDEEIAIPEILRFQKEVAVSSAFARRMTASGAIAFCAESTDASVLLELLRDRNRVLDGMGAGSICVRTEGKEPLREGSVLLVEPDRSLARLFSDFLTGYRFEVRSVESGEQALAEIARNPPAVVVCEERFPRSDVFELHAAFSRGTSSDGKGFLVLTEGKTESLVHRSYEAGIRYLLEKPVMLSEVGHLVKALWEDSLARR